jgi:hypothetical protein
MGGRTVGPAVAVDPKRFSVHGRHAAVKVKAGSVPLSW